MKKATSLNEQIERILKVSDYKISDPKFILKENVVAEAQPAPAAAPVQGQPQQQAPAQPQVNPQQAEANLEKELDIAMNQIVQNLPNELKQVDTNHDGQITVNDGSQQQAPVQGTTPTQPAQPVAESEFRQELKGQMNEIIATAASVAAAIPSMASLVGKAASFLGKEVGSGDLAQWGDKAQTWGKNMHHKYINLIGKLTAPFTKNLQPEVREKVNTMVFYAIVASLFAASIGGAVHAAHSGSNALAAGESGLSAIKASELVPAVNEIIPEILAAIKVG